MYVQGNPSIWSPRTLFGFEVITSRKTYGQTEECLEKKSKNDQSYRKYGQGRCKKKFQRERRELLCHSHLQILTKTAVKAKLFSMPVEVKTRSCDFENQQERFREDLMKTFLMIKIIKCWNRKKFQSQPHSQTLNTGPIKKSELTKYSYDLSAAWEWIKLHLWTHFNLVFC